MGCCQSRLKDAKEKSSCVNHLENTDENGIIDNLIRNKNKRIKNLNLSDQEENNKQNDYIELQEQQKINYNTDFTKIKNSKEYENESTNNQTYTLNRTNIPKFAITPKEKKLKKEVYEKINLNQNNNNKLNINLNKNSKINSNNISSDNLNLNLNFNNNQLINFNDLLKEGNLDKINFSHIISDFDNFNYNRDKISKLNLNKFTKSILNNNHLILKLTKGNLESSYISENSNSVTNSNNTIESNSADDSQYNPGFLNTSNVLSISTLCNEDNFCIDKYRNQIEDKSNDYFTIKSNIINSCNISKMSIKSNDEYNNNDKIDELLRGLKKKENDSIIFFFEFFFVILWAKDFLINSDITEECLVLFVEINDDYINREKIFFCLSIDERNKFIPIQKKSQINNPNFSFIKTIKRQDGINYEKNVHKISLKLCTYSNDILSIISEDEIFLNTSNTRQEGNIHKYKFYKNMYGNFRNKKLANILFNITYKKNENYHSNINYTYIDSNYSEMYTTNQGNISKMEKFSTYHEEAGLPFIYYGIKNQTILLNGSINNSNNNEFGRFNNNNTVRNNFFSIQDIEDFEISAELRSEKIPIERLIELLNISKKKFELYEILRKINFCVMMSQLNFESLIIIMQKIVFRLEEIKYNQELYDEVLTPFIYFVLKNLLSKSKKNIENFLSKNCFNSNDMNSVSNNKGNFNFADLNDTFFINNKVSNNRNGNYNSNSLFKKRNSNSSNNNNTNMDNSTSFINISNNNNLNSQKFNLKQNLNNSSEIDNSNNNIINNNNSLNNLNDININFSNQNENKDKYKDKEKQDFNSFNNNDNNSISLFKNNQNLKYYKESILKALILALKNIEFTKISEKFNFNVIDNNEISVENYRQGNLDYFSFFNLNRKKLSSSIFFISKVFEDFIKFTYSKNNQKIIIDIIIKEEENFLTKNANGKNKNSEGKISADFDENNFINYMNNLYFLLDYSSNYYDNADLIFNLLNIFIKMIKNKELIKVSNCLFENIMTDELFLKILLNFKNNIFILTNLFYFSTLYYNMMNMNYPEKLNFNLESIIVFEDLQNIFQLFKTIGFDQIHETIINLIKCILSSRRKLNKFCTSNFYSNNNNNNINTNTIIIDNESNSEIKSEKKNKINEDEINSSLTNQKKEKENKLNYEYVNSLSENELKIIINILSDSLKLLKNKINNFVDKQKIFKWIQNILTIIYTISNMSFNLLKISDTILQRKIYKILHEENISDDLIFVLSAINDKDVYSNIDLYYNSIDENVLNVKSIIFRSLYNAIILIRAIKDNERNSMTRFSAEKIFKFIKTIEENDSKFNPLILEEKIQTIVSNLSNECKNNNQKIINGYVNLLSSSFYKNLLDYYTRYKSILKDFLREIIMIIKQSKKKN